jgi:hypothetical protein
MIYKVDGSVQEQKVEESVVNLNGLLAAKALMVNTFLATRHVRV